jgi:hypothetical protein
MFWNFGLRDESSLIRLVGHPCVTGKNPARTCRGTFYPGSSCVFLLQ